MSVPSWHGRFSYDTRAFNTARGARSLSFDAIRVWVVRVVMVRRNNGKSQGVRTMYLVGVKSATASFYNWRRPGLCSAQPRGNCLCRNRSSEGRIRLRTKSEATGLKKTHISSACDQEKLTTGVLLSVQTAPTLPSSGKKRENRHYSPSRPVDSPLDSPHLLDSYPQARPRNSPMAVLGVNSRAASLF